MQDVLDRFRLDDRVALVTGASRGIGRAIAVELAKTGYHVLVHGHRNRQGAEEVARTVAEFSSQSTVILADLAQPGAVIRGIAQGSADDQEQMTSFYRPEIERLPEMELVARQVYAMSGLGPEEIDAAIIYDAFSSIVLFQLEAFGFCGIGEGKDFIKDGALRAGGRLPPNTHGGQLSEAYIHGINGVNEGVRLIRGTSVNQPDKTEHVLVTAGVGVPSSGMVLGQL